MDMTLKRRASGVLLHPTSLPGGPSVGDIGPSAMRFLKFLAEAGQTWWQMLPIGPPGIGNAPYSARSSFAGNPLLIAFDEEASVHGDRVPYAQAWREKQARLRVAFERSFDSKAFEAFRVNHHVWLDGYALYAALKEAYQGRSWIEWDPGIRSRHPQDIERVRKELDHEIHYFEFEQFLFHQQWNRLRDACRSLGIGLIGDVPFFVPLDSADVWARQELFDLNTLGRPRFVTGVPPDYFSSTGQLWGHPHYCWEAHRASGYEWWGARIQIALARFDAVRIDHFLGFHRAWAIPGEAPTAVHGEWRFGPGSELLEKFYGYELIAENLGLVTPESEALRERLGFPGIGVLQFGLSGDEKHLPHQYPERWVAVTGTHDNDTSMGWFTQLDETTRHSVLRTLGCDGQDIVWDVIHAVLRSPANTAIIPMQDLLGLGSEARMNYPGRAEGNWEWRLKPGEIMPGVAERLRAMTESTRRVTS